MMKHSIALLVAACTSLLAGCELYFGDGHNSGGGEWNYCGSDGYYTCQGDYCEWQGSTCPAGTGSGSSTPGGGTSGSGFDCQANSDCAAGCYCANGTCEEAGFCTQDSDCGMGYVCNEDRSSCEPAGTGPTTCDWDNQCAVGQYCSPDSHTCVATCVCQDDETAVANGFGWCDETRTTCLPGQDPAGTCGGAATCNLVQPSCPSGQVPTLIDGCWTGSCRDATTCDVAPECSHINDQPNCDARQDCHEVVNGINCKITGTQTPCQAGAMNCTCDSIVFAACAAN